MTLLPLRVGDFVPFPQVWVDFKACSISACFTRDIHLWRPGPPGTKADCPETTRWSGHGRCSHLQLQLSPAFRSPSPYSRHGREGAILPMDPPAPLFQTPVVHVTSAPHFPSPHPPSPGHEIPAQAPDIREQGKTALQNLSKFLTHNMCELTKMDIVLCC